MESGGTVNTLYAQNSSNDTVIILGGEIVKGGKQDRMIAQDVLIPPGNKKINLSVYCVEQHRWSSNDSRGNASNSAPASFSTSYNMSGTEVRKAALVNKNQSNVWQKVSETNTPRWPCWRKIRDDPFNKVGAICPRLRSQQGQLPSQDLYGQWDIWPSRTPQHPMKI